MQIQGRGGWRPHRSSIGNPELSPLKNTRFLIGKESGSRDFAHILADEAPIASPDLESQADEGARWPASELLRTGSESQRRRKRKPVLQNPAAVAQDVGTNSLSGGSHRPALARSSFAKQPSAITISIQGP